jgi:hypothetical protein
VPRRSARIAMKWKQIEEVNFVNFALMTEIVNSSEPNTFSGAKQSRKWSDAMDVKLLSL